MGVRMTDEDGTQRHGVMAPSGERTSRISVLSLALGLLAVVTPVLSFLSTLYVTGLPPQVGVIAIPAAVAAIVAGVLARRELRRDDALSGYGLSLAGVVLGVIALLLHVTPVMMPMLFAFGFLLGG